MLTFSAAVINPRIMLLSSRTHIVSTLKSPHAFN